MTLAKQILASQSGSTNRNCFPAGGSEQVSTIYVREMIRLQNSKVSFGFNASESLLSVLELRKLSADLRSIEGFDIVRSWRFLTLGSKYSSSAYTIL